MPEICLSVVVEEIPTLITDLSRLSQLLDRSIEWGDIAVWNYPGDIEEDYNPLYIVISGDNEKLASKIERCCRKNLSCDVSIYQLTNIDSRFQGQNFLSNCVKFSEFLAKDADEIAVKIAGIFGMTQEEISYTANYKEDDEDNLEHHEIKASPITKDSLLAALAAENVDTETKSGLSAKRVANQLFNTSLTQFNSSPSEILAKKQRGEELETPIPPQARIRS